MAFKLFDSQIKTLHQYKKTYRELFNLDKFNKKLSSSLLLDHNIMFPPRNVRMVKYLEDGRNLGVFFPYNKTIELATKTKRFFSSNIDKADIDSTFFHELFHAHIDYKQNFNKLRPNHSKYVYESLLSKNKNNQQIFKEDYFAKFAKKYLDNFEFSQELLFEYADYSPNVQIEEHLTNLFQHHMETGYLTGDKFMDREMKKFANKIKRTGLKYETGKLKIPYVKPVRRKTTIDFPINLIKKNITEMDEMIKGDPTYFSRTMKDTPPIYEAKVHDSRAPKVKQQLKANTKVNNFHSKSKKVLKGIFKLITAM
jgi:hypothetical protein